MSRALRLGAILAIVVAAIALYGPDLAAAVRVVAEVVRDAAEWTRDLGPVGLAAFAGIYAVATVFAVPGSALTLLAGGAFGFFSGALSVWVGATAGLAGAFLVARRFARGPVSRWLEKKPSFAAVDRAVAAEGWKIVFLTRLTPIFPFTFLNYAYGLTGVSFAGYLVASAIGILPGTLLYIYVGSIGAAALSGETEWALWTVGLAAFVTATFLITRAARRALREAGVETAAPTPPPDADR